MLHRAKARTQQTPHLPELAKPLSYNLNLIPELSKAFEYKGHVVILLEMLEDSDYIVLHAKGLEILDIFITDARSLPIQYAELFVSAESHKIYIHTEEELRKGEQYELKIEFSGVLSDDLLGFYRISYTSSDGAIRWIAATQFEPIHARRAFPCFDEPGYKATFKISIVTPVGYHSLSNMPIDSISYVDDDDSTLYEFEETPLMSTYLVAFIVSDYVNVSSTGPKYQFTTWTRPEVQYAASFSLEIAKELLDCLEAYTETEYKFPKVDQVAIPLFAPAMENWGLITYREDLVLYYDVSTEIDKKRVCTIMAHELSHMWFGNLVTLHWWSDTWLNEGFARYFQYYITDSVFPDWQLMDQFLVDQQQHVFMLDAVVNALPLSSECNTSEDMENKFKIINYNKGASVLRMLTHILTQTTFQKGLQRYLKAHQWSNVKPSDLFNALETQRQEDSVGIYSVPVFFKRWTTQPGFPVINIIRNNKNIIISQERFLINDTEKHKNNLKWWVPLTWTVEKDAPNGFLITEPLEWISPSEKRKSLSIEAEPKNWIIFNNQATGYYRVNYDEESWNCIIRGLLNNHTDIHVLNRAQLLDDALNLGRAGKMKHTLVLDMTLYLKNEEDYIPWASALKAFSYIHDIFMLTENYDLLKNYTLMQLENLYNKLGFEENIYDSHITKLHRMIMLTWTCMLGHQECVKTAINHFQTFLRDPSHNPITPNLRKVVYSTAIEHGGDTEWEFLWTLYEKSKIEGEKDIILSALGCTKISGLLKKYLEKIVSNNPRVNTRDSIKIFMAVSQNPKGFRHTMNFLRCYWEEYEDCGNIYTVSNFMVCILKRPMTEKQVQELERFIYERKKILQSADVIGRNIIKVTRNELQWIKKHKDSITEWLQNHTVEDVQ